ncbi:hypothetical protein BJ170DRAFT_607579 [Xylariales sp. AK1849]|nr:hypothetical protein BJ170DRAFT_607579 [Xylariales sp. AK1849]
MIKGLQSPPTQTHVRHPIQNGAIWASIANKKGVYQATILFNPPESLQAPALSSGRSDRLLFRLGGLGSRGSRGRHSSGNRGSFRGGGSFGSGGWGWLGCSSLSRGSGSSSLNFSGRLDRCCSRSFSRSSLSLGGLSCSRGGFRLRRLGGRRSWSCGGGSSLGGLRLGRLIGCGGFLLLLAEHALELPLQVVKSVGRNSRHDGSIAIWAVVMVWQRCGLDER